MARSGPDDNGASFLATAALLLLILTKEGVVPALAGLPWEFRYYLTSGLCLLGCFCWLLLVVFKKRKMDRSGWWPLTLFTYCVLVSVVSNVLIFRMPPGNWVTAQYILLPILGSFTLAAWNLSSLDVTRAVIIAALIGASLSVVNQFHAFDFMSTFYRRSAIDPTFARVVILKNYIALAAVLLVTATMYEKRFKRLVVLAAGAGLCLYSQVVLSESRLAVGATLTAVALFVLNGGVTGVRRVVVVAVGCTIGLFGLFFLLEKYIVAFTTTTNYIDDMNVQIRFDEFEYYYDYFLQTFGVGFGVMSTSGKAGSNLFSDVVLSTTDGGCGLCVADLGLWGALVQFGYIGIGLVVIMTFIMARRLHGSATNRAYPHGRQALAVGALICAFMLSPWPMNFFTLDWTAFDGAVLWYLAHRSWSESQAFENHSRREMTTLGERWRVATRARTLGSQPHEVQVPA